jgi:ElaB/YqjD/DUF883 family membrane-anchored ribosome-binding protein
LFGTKSGKNVVMVEYRSTPRWSNFYEGYIMDNQKPNEGSARDLGREGSGTSMAKDQAGRSEAKGSTGASGAGGGISGGSTGTANVSGAGNMSAMGGTGSTGSSTGTSGGSMGESVARGTSEMHRTIDKAAEAAQPVVDRLATTAHAGVDKMQSMLSGASQSMSQRQQQLTDAYGQLMDSGREYVRQKPGTAMMIAIGAGFLLARLIGGSRREY